MKKTVTGLPIELDSKTETKFEKAINSLELETNVKKKELSSYEKKIEQINREIQTKTSYLFFQDKQVVEKIENKISDKSNDKLDKQFLSSLKKSLKKKNTDETANLIYNKFKGDKSLNKIGNTDIKLKEFLSGKNNLDLIKLQEDLFKTHHKSLESKIDYLKKSIELEISKLSEEVRRSTYHYHPSVGGVGPTSYDSEDKLSGGSTIPGELNKNKNIKIDGGVDEEEKEEEDPTLTSALKDKILSGWGLFLGTTFGASAISELAYKHFSPKSKRTHSQIFKDTMSYQQGDDVIRASIIGNSLSDEKIVNFLNKIMEKGFNKSGTQGFSTGFEATGSYNLQKTLLENSVKKESGIVDFNSLNNILDRIDDGIFDKTYKEKISNIKNEIDNITKIRSSDNFNLDSSKKISSIMDKLNKDVFGDGTYKSFDKSFKSKDILSDDVKQLVEVLKDINEKYGNIENDLKKNEIISNFKNILNNKNVKSFLVDNNILRKSQINSLGNDIYIENILEQNKITNLVKDYIGGKNDNKFDSMPKGINIINKELIANTIEQYEEVLNESLRDSLKNLTKNQIKEIIENTGLIKKLDNKILSEFNDSNKEQLIRLIPKIIPIRFLKKTFSGKIHFGQNVDLNLNSKFKLAEKLNTFIRKNLPDNPLSNILSSKVNRTLHNFWSNSVKYRNSPDEEKTLFKNVKYGIGNFMDGWKMGTGLGAAEQVVDEIGTSFASSIENTNISLPKRSFSLVKSLAVSGTLGYGVGNLIGGPLGGVIGGSVASGLTGLYDLTYNVLLGNSVSTYKSMASKQDELSDNKKK